MDESTNTPQPLFGPEHVERYRATDGVEGHDWLLGAPTLLLTTTGRRTGEERTHPLIYQPHGDDHVVVASKGGWDHHPVWYLNLQADPNVQVQVWGDKFKARARTATAAERPELWKLMDAIWPAYVEYRERTSREIPIIVLERRTD